MITCGCSFRLKWDLKVHKVPNARRGEGNLPLCEVKQIRTLKKNKFSKFYNKFLKR